MQIPINSTLGIPASQLVTIPNRPMNLSVPGYSEVQIPHGMNTEDMMNPGMQSIAFVPVRFTMVGHS